MEFRMRPSAVLLAVAVAVLLAACSRETEGAPAAAPAAASVPDRPAIGTGSDDWRQVASPADASRLGRLAQAWRLARAEAEEKGFAAEVEALGPLVDPNAGLAGQLQPAPGRYRCRIVKLGASRPERPAFAEHSWSRCTIELTPGGDLVLTQGEGAQRSRGLLYPDTDRRLVFIGARQGDEAGWSAYGETPARDQIGVFERFGPRRWRLVIPWPKADAKLEILELAE